MNNNEATSIGTFEIVRFAEPSAVQRTADQLNSTFEPDLGFRSSDIFVSTDGTAVVHCAEWPAGSVVAGESGHLVRALAAETGARLVRALTGTLAVHIDGGSPREAPGFCVLAIRHVSDIGAAQELGQLLLRTGEWKREIPGFIGASAYISADGREFINYPQWRDEAAFEAYMADPRIAEGQSEISVVEVAEPEFIRGRNLSHLVRTSPGGRR